MELQNMEDRLDWWRKSRFGMMIHWGLYSALAGEWEGRRMDYIGEWIMSRFRIPIAEYAKLAEKFNPVQFDADQWVSLAKEAGMKYIIYTAKHHDGFAMYHSKCDGYNIVDATSFGRDPLAELAQACQKHDIRLCLYYSQALDWHEPDAGGWSLGHTNFGMSWCNDWDFPDNGQGHDHGHKVFERFFEKKVLPQVTELLTGYGPISAIWFDCPIDINQDQCERLYDLVRNIQPDCIMNSRLGNGLGDYQSLGDNMIPACRLEGDWECVGTLNDTWGYKSFDHNWKTSEEIIMLLSGLAGKGINYVLNVGPTGEGLIPPESAELLKETGLWTAANSEAVYDALPSPFAFDLPTGPVTQRPGKLYFHLQQMPADGKLCINGIRNRITGAGLLGPSAPHLVFAQQFDPITGRHTLEVELPKKLEAHQIPVVVVEFEGKCQVDPGLIQQGDGTILLPAGSAEILELGESGHESVTTANRYSPEGKRSENTGKPSICCLGAVESWYGTGWELCWDFILYQPGHYQVHLVTTGLHHSNPWKGGHQIQIRVGDQELSAEVVQDEALVNVATKCYSFASTRCGVVYLENPGEYKVVLSASHILDNEGVGLAAAYIRLVPEEA